MKRPGALLVFSPLIILLVSVAVPSRAQNNSDVRITPPDPTQPNSGLVEVFYDGGWGSICSDGWDFDDAAVACRQTLPALAWVERNGWLFDAGDVTDTVWLNNLQCDGHESNFDECPSDNKWTNQTCPSGKAAGVKCQNIAQFSGGRKVAAELGDGLGGSWRSVEGNAYLSLSGSSSNAYFALCSVGWSDEDADVFCRQLGRYGLAKKYGKSFFGKHQTEFSAGAGTVYPIPVNFQCDGTEDSLLDCPAVSVNGAGICYPGNDAGVLCVYREDPAGIAIQLVGGDSLNVGWVEVRHNGIWGSVGKPPDPRKIEYGDVICSVLDMGYATEVGLFPEVGQSENPVVVTGVYCTGAENSIAQCGKNLQFVNDEFGNMTRDDTIVTCSGKVQGNRMHIKLKSTISDEDYAAKGFLVMFVDGRWNSICRKDWTIENTRVACRELGYGAPFNSLEYNSGTKANGPMYKALLECEGTEATLDQCDETVMSPQECVHKTGDLYIGCGYKHVKYGIRFNPEFGKETSGPLEIFYGEWGSICKDMWDVKDAFVACRQLGFHWVEDKGWDENLGDLTGTKWLNGVECTGKETSLVTCGNDNNDNTNLYDHDCDTTAAVHCGSLLGYDKAAAFLRDGLGAEEVASEGTAYFEISASERGVICDHSWDMAAADVFCRQLGKLSALRVTTGSYYGRHPDYSGLFPTRKWNMAFECDGSESSLVDCVTYAKPVSACPNGQDAGVVCLEREVPEDFTISLEGGDNDSEGRVQVCYNSTCGSLGKDIHLEEPKNFGDVVCREVGQGYAVGVVTDGRFGGSSTLIKMNQIWCAGSEESIAQCGPHVQWLDSTDSALKDEDTGVICSGPIDDSKNPIRFTQLDDASGIVEIFHQGRFGTICNKGWTMENSKVVCRELGLHPPLEPLLGLKGYKGPIFLQDVSCTGTETSLEQCGHSDWSVHTCDHSMDMSVRCLKDPLPTPDPLPTLEPPVGSSQPLRPLPITLVVSFTMAMIARLAL